MRIFSILLFFLTALYTFQEPTYPQCFLIREKGSEWIRRSKKFEFKRKILKVNPKLKEKQATLYANLIIKSCDPRVQNDAIYIFARESRFHTMAKSSTGDYGLGQINFRTWHNFFDIKSPEELYNPERNIKISCTILQMAWSVHHKKAGKFYWGYFHSWNHIPRQIYIKKVSEMKVSLEN